MLLYIHPVAGIADFKHIQEVGQRQAWAEVIEQTDCNMKSIPVDVNSRAIAGVLPLAIHKDVAFTSNTPLEDPPKLGKGYATGRDGRTKIEKPSAGYWGSDCGVELLDSCTLKVIKIQGLTRTCCDGSESVPRWYTL
jgi:hypothetical protein